MRSVFYTTRAIAGVSTLVPHANAMAVAAATDITLAALDLFANIVVLTRRPKVFGIRDVKARHGVFMMIDG